MASGKLVKADHIVAHSAESRNLTGERDALVVVNHFSDHKIATLYTPKAQKTSSEELLNASGDVGQKTLRKAVKELNNAQGAPFARWSKEPVTCESTSACHLMLWPLVAQYW